MTDYHPLIARAVEGLDSSTGETRRALYERARTALVTQLRSVEPALSETEITKERLALEDAIRKVEADVARKSRIEVREPRPAAPLPRRDRPSPPADAGRAETRREELAAPPPVPDAAAEAQAPRAAAPTARERLLSARTPPPTEGIKGFRGVVNDVHDLGAATAKSAQSAREARDSYGPGSSQQLTPGEDATTSSAHAFEPQRLEAEELSLPRYESRRRDGREAPSGLDDEETARPEFARHPAHTATLEEEPHQPSRFPFSYRGLIKLVVVLIVIGGVATTVSWQWSNIAGLYQRISQLGAKQPSQTTQAPANPKFSGRVPQESAGQAPGPGTSSQTAPAVAQRVVLYEEDPNDPAGKRYVGSAIWRTETVSPGPGLAPELAVRADVEIPDRRMTVTWSMRRNTDQALPASHTIEIMFNLPADFPGGGISNVPGILMKQSEQARGTPLAGLAVKVTNGFFLIGLSAVDTDLQRNIQLLKDRPWFDIPIVYTNGGRAILAMEKGPPGDRAFAEAFAAWDKK